MKNLVRVGMLGVALTAAMSASGARAGGVAACMGSNQGRDGLTDFNAYSVARSDEASVTRRTLQAEAERQFRATNPENQRIRCRGYTGSGHFVIVRAAQALNGRTIQLIGFGFGETRGEAMAESERNLSGYPDYNMFIGRGGELEILEEGTVNG